MKIFTIIISFLVAIQLTSCGNGRSEAEQKKYVDSLFHVISCSPSIVDGPYTLEEQLEACDLLIREYPNKKEDFESIKVQIQEQIRQRGSEETKYLNDL